MKALKYGFGLALIGGFTLMAACGGSSSDTSDSGAGASSAGANSTTAGEGSTTAGTGSSLGGDTSVAGGDTAGAGTTAGGPGQGGTSSSAGGPGMGGAGKSGTAGAGGAATTNPKDCPAALPSGSCMPLANNQERCVYGDQSCRCRPPQQGGGMNQAGAGGAAAAGDTWQCTTVPVCPTAKPTAGADCTTGNEVCQYTGDGACVCNNNTKKWQCFGGMMGNAGAGGMSGTAGAGGGTAATPCPQMKPAADATCSGNNLCQYGKGTGCICDGTNWVCN